MMRRHPAAGLCLHSSTISMSFLLKSTDSCGQRMSTISSGTPATRSDVRACWHVSRVGASQPNLNPDPPFCSFLMMLAAIHVLPLPAGAMIRPSLVLAHSTAFFWYSLRFIVLGNLPLRLLLHSRRRVLSVPQGTARCHSFVVLAVEGSLDFVVAHLFSSNFLNA